MADEFSPTGASGAGDTAAQDTGTSAPSLIQSVTPPAGGEPVGNTAGASTGTGSFFDALPEDLRNSIPEELRNAEAFKDAKDLPEFLKRHADMAKALKDAPKAPESADAYTVPILEGVAVDEAYVGGFKKVAHEIGLSQTQVEKLATWNNEAVKAALEKRDAEEADSRVKANENGQQALQKPESEGGWGGKFAENLERARRAFNGIAGNDKDIGEWARDPRIGSDPRFLKFLEKASQRMSEDSLAGTSGGGQASVQRTADGRPMLNFASMDKK
jgi:hypothetical protein